MIIIALIVLFIGFVFYLASYLTHIQMNKNEKLPYDFVHFGTFIREFDRYKYVPTLQYNKEYKSIFLRQNDKRIIYLHASIVKFNDKCMIFYPISWIKYCIWMRKNFKEGVRNRIKGLWIESKNANER